VPQKLLPFLRLFPRKHGRPRSADLGNCSDAEKKSAAPIAARERDRFAEFIAKANEPTLLPSGDFEVLNEIAQKTYRDPRGKEHPTFRREVRFLSIPAGSLDDVERRQIESHVGAQLSIFWRRFPGPRNSAIPAIARAHHERINGNGYPFGLNSGQIQCKPR